ncbi:MAG: glutamine--fructose-6-phosphate aminotransferase [Candidatus Terrybacteria bacterium RIFCSPLOWO2_01_FULL_58_14]|uniref:Glutamine--fructose-6-phosphate aminotransferase [isomerizing] n=2 Tax=Candidatus Terryibacteriota TaxID=1817920 RepID=A0A1G2Q2Q8_9BACT|nr:MAG: glutamine--fructose-6-phosphate aminotransferase [Candidatus Terrybacteria bacterium RIFCSPHIGHO2_01_FULL_58_15]OHA54112.1 MAG: glutamine--fructose-6-phosphate aminotransferase [Candidatus Terrybacteria bacterium RIFCSPLOWO2_01_FULL_58_14]
MCGIVAYIGKREATPIVLDSLKRLEYRGYDSAGLTVEQEKRGPFVARVAGRVGKLEAKLVGATLPGTVAIAHTRWATHGAPSERNAHPHGDCRARIHLAHNGIIENHAALRATLIANGHRFSSDTDTEVIVHLVEERFRGTLEDAVEAALRELRGTWAIVVLSADDPGKIVAARNSSPLLLGVGSGEYLLASDASAVLASTKKVVYIEDGEMVTVTREGFRITNVDDAELRRRLVEIPWTLQEAEKGGHPHFMRKEISEGPEVVENVMRGRVRGGEVKLGGLETVSKRLDHVERIVLTAMGTSYHAALLGELFFEELAGIPAEVEYAAEFRYKRAPLATRNTALFAISQSGETADTLAALREAKRKGMLTIGIVNVVGSTVARETDAGLYNYAGPEIGVASTKAFLSQVVALLLAAIFLARGRAMGEREAQELLEALIRIPDAIRSLLKEENEIRALAKRFAHYENALFLGRKWSYPVALEGALKLKEVSYLHAEGYNAAEMKHGPIAMIDERFPTVAVVPDDSVRDKTLSNLEEIRARNGPIFAIATRGDRGVSSIADGVISIPRTHEILSPLLAVVPLQLLAYHIGIARGCDVDKPRNLAKSVTVE